MTIAMASDMIGLWVVQNYSFNGLFLATLLSFMAVVLSLITKMPFTLQKEKGKIQLFEIRINNHDCSILLSFAYGGITTFYRYLHHQFM